VAARRRDTEADQGGTKISAEDRARMAKAARQLAAYTNFLRWCANFQKDEVSRHPRSDRVILLSPMQSGRFAFRLQGEMGELGVQPFEVAWMSCMPFDRAYVTDRLYLSVEGVVCLNGSLASLGIGIFVDDHAKRQKLATVTSLRLIEARFCNGRLTPADREISAQLPVSGEDIANVFAARTRLQQRDAARFL
jgi:hypothetical protein